MSPSTELVILASLIAVSADGKDFPYENETAEDKKVMLKGDERLKKTGFPMVKRYLPAVGTNASLNRRYAIARWGSSVTKGKDTGSKTLSLKSRRIKEMGRRFLRHKAARHQVASSNLLNSTTTLNATQEATRRKDHRHLKPKGRRYPLRIEKETPEERDNTTYKRSYVVARWGSESSNRNPSSVIPNKNYREIRRRSLRLLTRKGKRFHAARIQRHTAGHGNSQGTVLATSDFKLKAIKNKRKHFLKSSLQNHQHRYLKKLPRTESKNNEQTESGQEFEAELQKQPEESNEDICCENGQKARNSVSALPTPDTCCALPAQHITGTPSKEKKTP